jgi:hypothetical protein
MRQHTFLMPRDLHRLTGRRRARGGGGERRRPLTAGFDFSPVGSSAPTLGSLRGLALSATPVGAKGTRRSGRGDDRRHHAVARCMG